LTSLSTQRQHDKEAFLGTVRGFVLAGLIAIAGCAMLDRRSPEEIVKERAQARWDAMVGSDLARAYGYFSPGSRAVLTLDGWSSTIKRGFWKKATVESVECKSADACDAIATIEYDMPVGRGRMKTPLRETWIREGANWWYVQK
jgi:hypothetical protein